MFSESEPYILRRHHSIGPIGAFTRTIENPVARHCATTIGLVLIGVARHNFFDRVNRP
jgi:hypothetical protein